MSTNTTLTITVNELELTFKSKSDAIRKLSSAPHNKTRTEVAKLLGIRYQFVRNILVNDENALITKLVTEANPVETQE